MKESEAQRITAGETTGDCELLSKRKSRRRGAVGEVDENICE